MSYKRSSVNSWFLSDYSTGYKPTIPSYDIEEPVHQYITPEEILARLERLEAERNFWMKKAVGTELEQIDLRDLPDDEAKAEVIQYVKKQYKNGAEKISDLDVVRDLCLPFEQVNAILTRLSKRK